MKLVRLLVCTFLLFAPGLWSESKRSDIFLIWTSDLSGIWFDPSEPRPEGIFVLVNDPSPETTHYYVVVSFVRQDGSFGWADLLFAKVPNAHSPAVIRAHGVKIVTALSVVAVKVTGYLSIP